MISAMTLFGNIKGLAYYASNDEDPYITMNDEVINNILYFHDKINYDKPLTFKIYNVHIGRRRRRSTNSSK
jgi:hypothetical protein